MTNNLREQLTGKQIGLQKEPEHSGEISTKPQQPGSEAKAIVADLHWLMHSMAYARDRWNGSVIVYWTVGIQG